MQVASAPRALVSFARAALAAAKTEVLPRIL
jgi:hypothetical protein